MGGELNKVGPTALPKRPARSCPAQPTIIQFIVFKLDKFTIYRCAKAAHIKKPAKRWHLCAGRIKNGGPIPTLDFASAVVG